MQKRNKHILVMSLCSVALLAAPIATGSSFVKPTRVHAMSSADEYNDDYDGKTGSGDDTQGVHPTSPITNNHGVIFEHFEMKDPTDNNYTVTYTNEDVGKIGDTITLDAPTLPNGVELVNKDEFPKKVTYSKKATNIDVKVKRTGNTSKTGKDETLEIDYIDKNSDSKNENKSVGKQIIRGKQGETKHINFTLPKGYYFTDNSGNQAANLLLAHSEYTFTDNNPNITMGVTNNAHDKNGDMSATIHYLDSKTNKELKTQTIKGNKGDKISIPWEYPPFQIVGENSVDNPDGSITYLSKADFLKKKDTGFVNMSYTFTKDNQNIYVLINQGSQDGNQNSGTTILPGNKSKSRNSKSGSKRSKSSSRKSKGSKGNSSHDGKYSNSFGDNADDHGQTNPDHVNDGKSKNKKNKDKDKNSKNKDGKYGKSHGDNGDDHGAISDDRTIRDNGNSGNGSNGSGNDGDSSADDDGAGSNSKLPQTGFKSASAGLIGVVITALSALGIRKNRKNK